MMWRIFPLTFSAIGFFFFSSFQEGQIRVEVEAVNVLVTVTDRNGRLVTSLPRTRFRVNENGVQQPITNFSHQTELPLSLALLIDTSSSIRRQLDFEKKAATQFLYSVLQTQDRALLVEFDTGVTLLHDFSNRPGEIANKIKGLRAGGGTAMLDALLVVCREKLVEGTGRKAIVIVSDGADRNSQHNVQEALQMVHKAGAIVYGIGTTRFAADVDSGGEKMLKKLAKETGGAALFPYSSAQLERSFELINQELRSQYSLTYVPINRARDGKFRKIEVRILQDKGLNIRHRKGYFAPTT